MEEKLRKQAVQRHLAGESPKAVYTNLNRSKNWFFKWLKRYQTGAIDRYKEHSRAPLTRPSEESLNIFGENFEVSKDLVYSYVRAMIVTEIHTLQVYLGKDFVQSFEYRMPTEFIS